MKSNKMLFLCAFAMLAGCGGEPGEFGEIERSVLHSTSDGDGDNGGVGQFVDQSLETCSDPCGKKKNYTSYTPPEGAGRPTTSLWVPSRDPDDVADDLNNSHRGTDAIRNMMGKEAYRKLCPGCPDGFRGCANSGGWVGDSTLDFDLDCSISYGPDGGYDCNVTFNSDYVSIGYSCTSCKRE